MPFFTVFEVRVLLVPSRFETPITTANIPYYSCLGMKIMCPIVSNRHIISYNSMHIHQSYAACYSPLTKLPHVFMCILYYIILYCIILYYIILYYIYIYIYPYIVYIYIIMIWYDMLWYDMIWYIYVVYISKSKSIPHLSKASTAGPRQLSSSASWRHGESSRLPELQWPNGGRNTIINHHIICWFFIYIYIYIHIYIYTYIYIYMLVFHKRWLAEI